MGINELNQMSVTALFSKLISQPNVAVDSSNSFASLLGKNDAASDLKASSAVETRPAKKAADAVAETDKPVQNENVKKDAPKTSAENGHSENKKVSKKDYVCNAAPEEKVPAGSDPAPAENKETSSDVADVTAVAVNSAVPTAEPLAPAAEADGFNAFETVAAVDGVMADGAVLEGDGTAGREAVALPAGSLKIVAVDGKPSADFVLTPESLAAHEEISFVNPQTGETETLGSAELAQKILDWRGFSKLKSTYTDSLLELLDNESRVHTTFSQTVVNTGRLASSNPNLQNIPIRSEEGKKIRQCFGAPKGYKIIAADYSQVELRLMASVADVKALKEAFAHGADIHAATASHVFGVPREQVTPDLRRQAKAINFGIVYGISQFGLSKQLNVSREEAKAYIDAYFKKMPEIKQYMNDTILFAREHGFVLTPFGRKCYIHGINDRNKRNAANAERAAINAPIQGGAADIIKLAMNKVGDELAAAGLKTRMLLQVHDELVFEAPESEVEQAAAIIKKVMETVVNYAVPLIAEVGVGDNWTEAH